MSFPLTAAAAQVESFEALNNEGLWVTPEALTNIESRLQELENTSAETTTALTEANNSTATAIENTRVAMEAIAERDATIATLQARVEELEAEDPGFQNTNRDQDLTGDQNQVPFHLSDKNPMNTIADRLPGIKKV